MKPIVLFEHQSYDGDSLAQITELLEAHNVILSGMPDEYMGIPKNLALDSSLTASYYIGATWLVENELSAIVLPKIQHVDYLEMFMSALSVDTKEESDYFSKSYGIDFEKAPIETTEDLSQLTPLLLVHYITLLEKLVSHGLKKDYIQVTENLKNKVKGHIVISQQIKRNIIPGRKDRNVCTYQIYTADIPTNRLLKEALLFAQKMLVKYLPSNRNSKIIQTRINKILPFFNEVSDNIQVSIVKKCSGNKLYKHYSQAIKVAKDILRRYDYSLSNVSKENHKSPCFWIDMSRLFELYVYSKLLKTPYWKDIKFQVRGYQKTAVDYIHIGEKIIIDAKYKPRYDRSYCGILPDIREISGYSRDLSILKHFGREFIQSNLEVKCLIIYPQDAFSDEINDERNIEIIEEINEIESMNEFSERNSSLWNQASEMKYFRNFRKLKIPLPIIT